jgi:hypothetical protein
MAYMRLPTPTRNGKRSHLGSSKPTAKSAIRVREGVYVRVSCNTSRNAICHSKSFNNVCNIFLLWQMNWFLLVIFFWHQCQCNNSCHQIQAENGGRDETQTVHSTASGEITYCMILFFM